MPNRRATPWTLAQRQTLLAMSVANIAVALDFAGVNVALPTISEEFDASNATLESITLAYLLTLTVMLVPSGRVADLRGRRRTWLVGLGVFAVASLASAGAQSSLQLVLARGATGIGAAIITATMLSLMATAFQTADERGRAVGAWSAIGAIGVAIGPLVAGILTGVGSWRWFFALGVVLAVGSAVLAGGGVPESSDERGERVDWWGAAMLIVALTAFVLALHFAPHASPEPQIALAMAVVAVVATVLLVRQERRSSFPLVDPTHLRSRGFRVSCAVAFLANVAFAAVMFFLALYLQDVYGLGPAAAGATFLALTVALALLSPVAGRGSARWGATPVMGVGMAILSVSFLVFALIDVDTGLGLIIVGLFLSGGGQAFAFNGSNLGAVASVPADDLGVASGVVNAMRQAGSLIGLAVAGALFRIIGGTDPGPTQFVEALRPTMLFVAVVCAGGAVLALVARRRDLASAPSA